MSLLTDGNLLPFRQYTESDVINQFSLTTTGLNGMLVALVTGGQDPATSAGGYTTAPVGAGYTNVFSTSYLVSRQVRPTQAGDTAYNTLGVTLHTVALNDENGLPLRLIPYDKTIERGLVQTGFAVPILTRGIITIKQNNVDGIGFPGWVGVVSASGNGRIAAVNPSLLVGFGVTGNAFQYSGNQIVGKFISQSGSAFGGYYQFKLGL